MEEPKDHGENLSSQGRAHQVQGDSGKSIFLKESHQKAKAEEDHHMDILENWNRGNIKNYPFLLNSLFP